MSKKLRKLKEELLKKPEKKPQKKLSTGLTLLNLAMTEDPFGGLPTGKIVNIIGASAAGKTMLAFSILAEAAHDPYFDDYLLWYDDAERAMAIDVEKLFGKKTYDRVLGIEDIQKEENPYRSKTVEDVTRNLTYTLEKEGKSCIYVLDSLDAVDSEAALLKSDKDLEKRTGRSGYGTDKARALSDMWRRVNDPIIKTNSIFIVISQTRANIGFDAAFKPHVSGGGEAKKFYMDYEMWLSITKDEKIRNRSIGTSTRIRISKNKITGKRRDITCNIYNDYGIDDIGSNIEFLITEGFWNKNGQKINTNGFTEEHITKRKLIEKIEDDKLEINLALLVKEKWMEIEEAISLKRKNKYD